MLTDFGGYLIWNSFVTAIAGELQEAAGPRVRIGPRGGLP